MMLQTLRYYVFSVLLVLGHMSCAQPGKAKYGGLWTVDISHDDKYIATGGDDSLLRIFTKDFSIYRSVKLERQGMIRAVNWHPKENIIAIATRHDAWIMDPATGAGIQLEGQHGGSRTIAWNYDGTMLAAAAGHGIVWIWDRRGKLLKQIQKKTDGADDTKDFLGLDWHPSRNILVTVGDEVRIFDTSGNQLIVFEHREKRAGILTVKWHPSGELFVTGDYGHPGEGIPTLLQFWTADGKLIREWAESKKELRNIRWNKQGTALATGSDALRILTKEGELLYTTAQDGNTVLWGVDWMLDSDKIVTVNFDNGKIQAWDNKGKLLNTYQ